VVAPVIDRVLERAGEQLLREVDGPEARVRVDELVAGHGEGSTRQGSGHTFPSA
jgi:hypothetical protein